MSKFTERLRDENYAGPMQHLRSHVEIDALFNQAADIIDELERALCFYAEKQNYYSQLVTEDCGCCSYWHNAKVEDDEGQTARNALERLK